ncbi:MAG: alpha/beta hydrolase [Sulfitobacter sp.]
MNAQSGFAAHVTTLGQGARPALALHCTMAFGGAWASVQRALGRQVSIRAPDMPSHGGSPDWDEVSDFGDTCFAAALDAMGPEPCDVIGHSFGAAIALRMAVEHPERLRSLTLFEPVLFAIAMTDDPASLAEHDTSVIEMTRALERGDRAGAARAFNGMWSEDAKWDTLPERSRAAMARAVHVVPGTRAFIYEDTSGLLEPGRLEAVMVPTLVMRGSETLPAIKAVNAGLARRLGNAREAVITGAGHMGPITHPAEVAAEIKLLLARSRS